MNQKNLKPFQKEFIEFALKQGVLKFGAFTLKSGRTSPYFFNSGLFDTGLALSKLGSFYAKAIEEAGIDYDVLLGPAYKGIPLVSATSIALANDFNKDVPYVFNRKEKKNHGEGGLWVGAPLKGKVLIVDDVITAGTAIAEVMELLSHQPVEVAGVVVAMDRQEKASGELSAIQEVAKKFGIEVISIVCLDQLLGFIEQDETLQDHLVQVQAYRAEYGV
ncbi:MAG: orotate phosphoribosyltransferase [Saccharospirillaceae bacterium]|nr:orotate phosphoribosyltransferase [Pseudomonadales bacterium]NRB81040.1 orotate phosphoribosyltransferase [Saccharospirillaceae bacterium]